MKFVKDSNSRRGTRRCGLSVFPELRDDLVARFIEKAN